MPNPSSHGSRAGAPGRAAGTLPGIGAWIGGLAAAAALLAAGVAAAGVQAGEFTDPTEAQYAILQEALESGVVPAELALAVERSNPDGRRVVGRADRRARDARRSVADLGRLYHRYGERWDLALSHYYGGPLAMCEGRYVSHVHTVPQVAEVLERWRRYQEDRTLADLVQRTRAMQARSARFAALDAGGVGTAPGTDYDAPRRRPGARLSPGRGVSAVALPSARGRFRSDDRPVYGAAFLARPVRFE